jgi:penicillin-insensitive murein DD-endopeptidase
VRPWPGHDDHLHVRLSCPADSPDCIDQAEAVGDGCGHAELAAAMAHEIARRRRPPPAPNRVLPASCDEVREATSAPAAPTLSRSD